MLIRNMTFDDLHPVIALYRTCFSEPPWFEEFDPVELEAEFREILSWSDSIFLVYEINGSIVGATSGFSIERKADVRALISESQRHTFYFSELFVHKTFRCQGIAKQLVQARLDIARGRGFTYGVVRTSLSQSIIQHLYLDEFGFEIVATQDVVSTKVIDGVKQEFPDRRVIMVGKI